MTSSSGSPSLNAALPPYPHLPTSYFPSTHFVSSPSAPRSWVFLYTCYLFPLAPSGFFNRMLAISEPGGLTFYTIFPLILLTLFVSRNLALSHFPFSGFLDSLLCDLIAPTPGLAFSLLMQRTLVVASSGRPYSSVSSQDSYSDYVRVSISKQLPSISYLTVYARLLALQWIAESTSFLFSFFSPPEISSFWGTSIAITQFGTQRVLPNAVERKYLIGSSLLTSSPLMNLTYLLFSIAPLLRSPLLPPFALSCSCELLQGLGSDYL